jgi:Flp pilus assembly protein TadD
VQHLAALLLTALLCPAPTPAPTPAPVPSLLEQGERLLQGKQYAKAEAVLLKAVEADPTSARAHGNLALALLPQKKVREAVNEGRLAAAFEPSSPEARYIYGLTLTADGKPIEAAREYEKVVALKPDEAVPLEALAGAYAAAEDPRTVATYEKLIALKPGEARFRASLAEYLWQTDKLDQGNTVMLEALAAFPADPGLALQYGRALVLQERLADATVALESARRLGNSDPRTLALLASAYERAGRAEQARSTLTAAVDAHPEDASLQHDLGRLWLAEGRADEAFAHLETAARAQPGSAVFQLDFGRALEASGKLAEAEQAYRRAVALSPNLPGAHFALGRLLQREGKKEEAERELEIHHALYERGRQTVAAADAKDATASLAMAQLNQGKAAEALARFKSLPESAESLRGQALALQRLGRHAEAVRALERAHALAPDDARIELLLVAEQSRAGEPR